MIIYTRKDNSPVETLRNFNSPISMNGKWVLDCPDGVSPNSLEGTPADVITREIEPQMLSLYPSYESVIFNPLMDSSNVFEGTQLFPSPSGQTPSRYKVGVIPNVACVLSKNDTQGAGREGVGITYEIDITANTSDGLGRQTFLPYWRGVTKTTSMDISPVYNLSEQNVPSQLVFSQASSVQYSVYLSGDNGNTYERVDLLQPFSFNNVVDTIRFAFVNESAADVFILSYALMF